MVNEAATSSERMMTPELMVTGEAVALEVLPASPGTRILAGIIDYTLYAMGLLITIITGSVIANKYLFSPSSQALAAVAVALVLLAWLVMVPLTVELLTRGRSAGRLVTGLRIVRDDGGAVRLRHSLVRALVGVVEIWLFLGVPATAACVVTRRGKRLGDLLAGTYAVRDRNGVRDAPPILMPPELAAWAANADLRALPGHEALVIRTFLQRASSMQAQARLRLAMQLAAQAEPYVAPPPPPGTHPERFLAALLAARRDREFMLELRDRRVEDGVRASLQTPPHQVARPGDQSSVFSPRSTRR
ncbi:RDD family protein [Actinomyces sp. MRS3W]|uniref:RDD family protein n=1 Tax=Actinomyces sp. MRS3W TaxID=2800796 RepID=UPI0028FD750A|nr:RDD family protein [Actinomyces sp. MRS3W]MDU0349764.1 RDD family protein [Actinomyces sp. MRS3W]